MTPDKIIESQRANLAERCAREDTLLRVICDIRMKTGLGHKPMLSELPDAICSLINAAYSRAIEDAAKVADARDLSIMSSTIVDVEARKIAAAIRNLKQEPE